MTRDDTGVVIMPSVAAMLLLPQLQLLLLLLCGMVSRVRSIGMSTRIDM